MDIRGMRASCGEGWHSIVSLPWPSPSPKMAVSFEISKTLASQQDHNLRLRLIALHNLSSLLFSGSCVIWIDRMHAESIWSRLRGR